ncbi:MAG: CinA family nicotinamide mononucleotide deamidase-related protein [Anaerolineae bacterium]
MQAEIVTIGTELLLGEIVDTNSAWIAQRLTTVGLDLRYTLTVGDNLERIANLLRESLRRSEVVITTGGLGPTVDDMTREAVAQATGRELVLDEDLLQEIAAFFAQRGRQMTDNNRSQAYRPAGSRVMRNPVGTAPCFAVEEDEHVIICLPGVPHEMRYMMEHLVLPFLGERFGLKSVIKSRILRTCNIGESTIGALIDDLMRLSNPTVGTAAHPGQTDVRITAKADSKDQVEALIAPVEDALRARLGDYVFGVNQQTISDVVAELLCGQGHRLALVETATRGEMAQALSTAPHASDTLAGSMVLLGQAALEHSLGLDPALALTQGMASQPVADAAACAVCARLGADLGLAVIGEVVDGETQGGLVYISLYADGQVIQATPRETRRDVAGRGWMLHTALDLLRRHLLGLPQR